MGVVRKMEPTAEMAGSLLRIERHLGNKALRPVWRLSYDANILILRNIRRYGKKRELRMSGASHCRREKKCQTMFLIKPQAEYLHEEHQIVEPSVGQRLRAAREVKGLVACRGV